MALELPTLVQRYVIDASQTRVAQAQITGTLGRIQGATAAAGRNLTKHLTIPIIAFTAGAIAAARTVGAAMSTIAVRTGATGEELAGLRQDFEAVGRVSAEPLQHVADVMANLRVRTGLVGEPLRRLSHTVLELQRITGETAPSVDQITRVFGQWQIATDQQVDTLNLFFKASQQTQVPLNILFQQVQAFSPALKIAGFGLEETIALVGALGKAGINAQQSIFGIRTFLTNAAKAGKEPARAFAEIVHEIEALAQSGKKTEAVSLGLRNFGARGVALAQAVAEGRLNFQQLQQAIEASGNTIEETGDRTFRFSKLLGQVRNQVELSLAPIGEEILPLISGGVRTATTLFTGLAHAIGSIPALGPILGIGLVIGPSLFIISKMIALFHTLGTVVTGIRATMLLMALGGETAMAGLAASLGALAAAALPVVLALGAVAAIIAVLRLHGPNITRDINRFGEATVRLRDANLTLAQAQERASRIQSRLTRLEREGHATTEEYRRGLEELADAQLRLGDAASKAFVAQRSQARALTTVVDDLHNKFVDAFEGARPEVVTPKLEELISKAREVGVPLDVIRERIARLNVPLNVRTNALSLFDQMVRSMDAVAFQRERLDRIFGRSLPEASLQEANRAFDTQQTIVGGLVRTYGDFAARNLNVRANVGELVRTMAGLALAEQQVAAEQGKHVNANDLLIGRIQQLQQRFPQLTGLFDGYVSALRDGVPLSGQLAKDMGGLQSSAAGAADGVDRAKGALSGFNDKAVEARGRILGFTQTNFRAWAAGVTQDMNFVKGSLDDLSGQANLTSAGILKAFTKNFQEMTHMRENLDILLARHAPVDLINSIAAMGQKGAGIAAAYAKANDREFTKINNKWNAARRGAAGFTDDARRQFEKLPPVMRRVVDDVNASISGIPDHVRKDITAVLQSNINGRSADISAIRDELNKIKGLDPVIRKQILAQLVAEIRARIVVDAPKAIIFSPEIIPERFGGGIRVGTHILRHQGGIIPGIPGSEVDIRARAGEGIFTAADLAALQNAVTAARQPAAVAGLATSSLVVSIGDINVTTPSGEPRAVAEEVSQAIVDKVASELGKRSHRLSKVT